MSEQCMHYGKAGPCERPAVEVKPWKPEALEKWARRASSGEYHAALFILACWTGGRAKPPFMLLDALGVWDDGNRRAFQGWAAEPWAR